MFTVKTTKHYTGGEADVLAEKPFKSFRSAKIEYNKRTKLDDQMSGRFSWYSTKIFDEHGNDVSREKVK